MQYSEVLSGIPRTHSDFATHSGMRHPLRCKQWEFHVSNRISLSTDVSNVAYLYQNRTLFEFLFDRPPFKIIAAHLEIAGEELSNIKVDCFNVTQATWRKEVQDGMEKFYARLKHNILVSRTNNSRL